MLGNGRAVLVSLLFPGRVASLSILSNGGGAVDLGVSGGRRRCKPDLGPMVPRYAVRCQHHDDDQCQPRRTMRDRPPGEVVLRSGGTPGGCRDGVTARYGTFGREDIRDECAVR